ncbi:hypothetical protein HBA54_18705 [Pelagibius litoralis]|uniref:Uncharacterized protein n=1 Tax=Pelagibius litoralis TaxID=374515 RepID=A0A967KAR4_9PROT|nr:hypothetical protein [Pelagibius litoralis]NIA70632.1 hypothetical protein [Pelagibius litoralis]
MSKKRIFGLLMVFILLAAGYGLVTSFPDHFDLRGRYFTAEPGLRQIENLSAAQPRVLLPELLEDDWQGVCFVPPYYAVQDDPKLAGADIPWTSNDGLYTIALRRGDDYDLHKISRGKVVEFQLTGIGENEACYDSTALAIEYVAGSGPIKLRVVPRE